MKCKYCNCVLRPHYTDLLKYADSKKHKDYIVPAPQQLKQFLAQVSKPNFDQARREVRIALFTATHASVSAVDELDEILQQEFDRKFRMHWTKCAAVIKNVLAPHFKHKLDKMKEAPGYSLMLDESTDVSTAKQLCICVRFHNSETNSISDMFLDLKEVANGTAEVMHQCVMDILSDHGLSLRLCWNSDRWCKLDVRRAQLSVEPAQGRESRFDFSNVHVPLARPRCRKVNADNAFSAGVHGSRIAQLLCSQLHQARCIQGIV
ncbi:hypothetical protein HPB49_011995 [Dermacentor silvarum]|uniref:Uncharacterized protein n=1 Tax=Dermacentor silvarum TaxID=543639 RepID=A0ACB8C929_DERSI|nr:hypothetical protein HPB49_011995 [Dermacentor silvarum]